MTSIYKPNSKNTGCACSFNQAEDGNIYINAVQQESWDADKKIGRFSKDEEKKISIKLNEWEAVGIIRAINTSVLINPEKIILDKSGQPESPLPEAASWSAFHSYGENKTQISLKPWVRKGYGEKPQTLSYGLSITRNSSDKFKLPIEVSEAEVIKTFLTKCLYKKFTIDEKTQKSFSSQQ